MNLERQTCWLYLNKLYFVSFLSLTLRHQADHSMDHLINVKRALTCKKLIETYLNCCK